MVSHDLRSPLTVTALSANLLASTSTDPRVQQTARRIAGAAKAMSRLTADLVDATSIQAGRLSLHLDEHGGAELVAAAAAVARPLADDRGVTLAVSLPDEGPVVRCDRDRLLQVLGNLLGNALKFVNDGGRVELALRVEGAEAVLSVADDGPGIPPDALERVFDRGFQVAGPAASRGPVHLQGARRGARGDDRRREPARSGSDVLLPGGDRATLTRPPACARRRPSGEASERLVCRAAFP